MSKGKICCLTESHFDETEFRVFNEFWPKNDYEFEYLSYLWNQPSITFKGNDYTSDCTVTQCVTKVEPTDYKAILMIGGYAMDRLRYEEHPKEGQLNNSPAVQFLRKAVKAMDEGKLKIGTICHSLWLFCAYPPLIKGRKVTCAHNIMYDVMNAGGIVVYDGEQNKDIVIDGNLITGRHPGVVDQFVEVFIKELEK
ncbi:MAG: DJ-1/PfpI family protein [Candidatus Magnetoovum sp. WYHC-5]|nr:DJ-1/PfpI family protein [Candidatus Magnetoovum sp. WYHC-5]